MKNKLMLGLIIGILVLGLISAAWYFIFTSGLSIRIDSLGTQKDVILYIPNMNLNTTNSSASNGAITSFVFNKAGSFLVSITETFGDLSGGQCINGTDDCLITYAFGDGNSTRLINNNQIISIPANTNVKTIASNISCVAYSCPQTRDIIIKLNQVS